MSQFRCTAWKDSVIHVKTICILPADKSINENDCYLLFKMCTHHIGLTTIHPWRVNPCIKTKLNIQCKYLFACTHWQLLLYRSYHNDVAYFSIKMISVSFRLDPTEINIYRFLRQHVVSLSKSILLKREVGIDHPVQSNVSLLCPEFCSVMYSILNI